MNTNVTYINSTDPSWWPV